MKCVFFQCTRESYTQGYPSVLISYTSSGGVTKELTRMLLLCHKVSYCKFFLSSVCLTHLSMLLSPPATYFLVITEILPSVFRMHYLLYSFVKKFLIVDLKVLISNKFAQCCWNCQRGERWHQMSLREEKERASHVSRRRKKGSVICK